MTSPSEPVESREQPREVFPGDPGPSRNLYGANEPTHVRHLTMVEALAESERLLAERDATIRELRAEAAREFESGNDWCQRAIAAESDLAAALAEVSRLREQGEAAMGAHEPWADHDGIINCQCGWECGGDGLTFFTEHLRAILNPDAREGE